MFIISCVLKQNKLNFVRTSCKFSSSAITTARKKVCIVGAGPAGFYAAQHILKRIPDCDVDVLEKLPVPFGLVRFGVAPDHPEVKNVINTFTKTAEHPNFRFLGNLSLGKDITLQQLRDSYHAVLLTYGANKDRRMNIPNEDCKKLISARKFVAWYNGLPGSEDLNPDLSGETVTVVGQGNVAVDVARMILSPIDALKTTDTTEYALEGLSRSKVKNVFLVGRRGPLQAAFTIKELREMLKLPNVATIWRESDFQGVPEVIGSLARPRKRLTELMLKSLNDRTSASRTEKRFLPVFQRAPKEIHDDSIEFTVTELRDNTAIPTDVSEKFPTDLILRSIGYKSVSVDSTINFDEQRGLIPNNEGRVLKSSTSGSGEVDRGLYVAGWLGTGPTGVILTTMNYAFGVAKSIYDDIAQNKLDTSSSKPGLELSDKRVVTWNGWQKIDKAEIAAGQGRGKPREKIVDIENMLRVAGV